MSDELPEDIRALIDADRRTVETIPEEARKRILRNVGTAMLAGGAVGVATVAAAKAAAGSGAIAFLGDLFTRKASIAVTAFFLGGAAGAGGYVAASKISASKPAPTCPSAVAITPPPAPNPTFVAPIVPPAPVPSASVSAAPSVASAPAPSPSPSNTTDKDLAAEEKLATTASAALARGEHQNALAACDLRAKQYPLGRMSEECEYIAIRALVGLGRNEEASARADRFRATYPQSLYLGAVDAAVKKP